MVKKCIDFSIQRGDRAYSLHVPDGSPVGELYDVVYEILQKVCAHAQDIAQKAAPQEIPAQSDAAPKE
jgi:hypothetical protein